MKKVLLGLFVAGLAGCQPLATCEDSEYPELCGSDVCEQAVTCCDQSDLVSGICSEVSSGLTEVPEAARQYARDTACEQIVENAVEEGVCLLETADAGE